MMSGLVRGKGKDLNCWRYWIGFALGVGLTLSVLARTLRRGVGG
jgi:hypothetical protein